MSKYKFEFDRPKSRAREKSTHALSKAEFAFFSGCRAYLFTAWKNAKAGDHEAMAEDLASLRDAIDSLLQSEVKKTG